MATRRGRRAKARRWIARGRRFLRKNVLGLDDTPHRIAWGVFLGFLISFTPTLGMQIVLYVLTATLLRANKVSGIPPLFISNPFSAVPLYYGTWWVGNLLATGGVGGGGHAAIERMITATSEAGSIWDGMFQASYWETIGAVLLDLGAELWIGGLFCGTLFGALAYPIAFRSVVVYRKRVSARRAERSNRREQAQRRTDAG